MVLAKVLYGILLWGRWIVSSTPGYIHPDEYFQSAEVTARTVLDVHTFIPWEFKPTTPIRSVIPPFLSTGLPFAMIKWGSSSVVPNAVDMFLVERFSGFLATLIMDYALYRICRTLGRNPMLPMALLSTSHVVLVYYVRPFSNAIESLILVLSLWSFCTMLEEINVGSAFCLGSLLAAGVLTRITFALFGFPLGVAFIYQCFTRSALKRVPSLLSPFILGATLVTAVFVLTDSIYYQTMRVTLEGVKVTEWLKWLDVLVQPTSWTSIRLSGYPVLTFWNNFRYNSVTENLKEHGLHPLYTHLLVNMPLLYGPLVAGVLAAVKRPNQDHIFYRTLSAIIIVGLGGLSLIPHQEARFLVPLLIPLILVFAWDRTTVPKTFWVMWMMFNFIMTFVFGYLHQGGIVPTMMYLQRQSLGVHDCKLTANGEVFCNLNDPETAFTDGYNVTSNLLFYKTYMAPRHLIGYPNVWEVLRNKPHVRIVDFAGDFDGLEKELEQRAGVSLMTHHYSEPKLNFAPSKLGVNFER
ncbi:Alg9-like mannosyltransferase family-domain-containing protein [Dichotomocladium elegans]|nr:Alg9-like mannosyltransferase family-domain-containing protein [Dichotomocladium elegans]